MFIFFSDRMLESARKFNAFKLSGSFGFYFLLGIDIQISAAKLIRFVKT